MSGSWWIWDVNAEMRDLLSTAPTWGLLVEQPDDSADSREGQLASRKSINDLPPETLSEIFIWLMVMFPCYSSAWSPILLVSQKWHNVAIACPQLWTELDLLPNIPQDILDRSCAQPLSLHWYYQGPEDVPLARYSAYLPRARSLTFCGLPEDNGTRAFDGITSFPLLEYLVVYSQNKRPLPEIFTSGDFPKLVALDVALSWNFEWNYTIFSSNLRVLFIDGTPMTRRLTLTELLDGLRSMPLLDCLQLVNLILGAEEEADPAFIVPFQELQLLSLEDSVERCTAFLKRLKLLPSIDIDVQCHLRPDDFLQLPTGEEPIPELLQALGDKIALRDDSGSLLSPMKYMRSQEHVQTHVDPLGNISSTGVDTRLHLMRNDKPFGESLQQNLQFFKKVCDERHEIYSEKYRNGFQGVRITFSWMTSPRNPDLHVAMQLLHLWLPTWISHWQSREFLLLEQVSTVALDLRSDTSSMHIGKLCPNVTTVIASESTTEIQALPRGLSYLLDIDKDGRHCLHFPKLQTLILDLRITYSIDHWISFLGLQLIECDLNFLPYASTLKKICLVAETPDLEPPLSREHANESASIFASVVSTLKIRFPHIEIAMLDCEFSEWARA